MRKVCLSTFLDIRQVKKEGRNARSRLSRHLIVVEVVMKVVMLGLLIAQHLHLFVIALTYSSQVFNAGKDLFSIRVKTTFATPAVERCSLLCSR